VRVGLLLPHFGDTATWTGVFGFATEIESLGFDSVWARDNLDYTPHAFEPSGNHFIDPFTVLCGVAARTKRLQVGTAVLTPFRPALVTAQLIGGLCYLSQDRFVLGLGPGTPRRPWELVGLPYAERVERCRETAEVIRVLSIPGPQSYHGSFTRFDGVDLQPAPSPGLTIWYGGASTHALAALATYADGLLPGRCPLAIAKDWIARHVGEGDTERPRLGLQTLVVLAASRKAALRRLTATGTIEAIARRWRRSFETLADLEGAVVAGPPADCAEQLAALAASGVELAVLDCRLAGDRYQPWVRALARALSAAAIDVMPAPTSAPALGGPVNRRHDERPRAIREATWSM
jgi:alkanesulfonate monooxygenase SsuD/methylene tetrahydromethanopterin reductase-like flavin-dependent oxidoreductase (luciferase family)